MLGSCVITRILAQSYRVVGRDPSRRNPATDLPRGLPQSLCRNPSGSKRRMFQGLRWETSMEKERGRIQGPPAVCNGRAGTPSPPPHPAASSPMLECFRRRQVEPLSPASGDLGKKRDTASPCDYTGGQAPWSPGRPMRDGRPTMGLTAGDVDALPAMSARLTTTCPGTRPGWAPYTRPDPQLAALVLEEAAQGLGARGPWEAWLVLTRGQKFPHVMQEEKMPAVSNRTDSTNLILFISVLILFSVELSAEASLFIRGSRGLAEQLCRPTGNV